MTVIETLFLILQYISHEYFIKKYPNWNQRCTVVWDCDNENGVVFLNWRERVVSMLIELLHIQSIVDFMCVLWSKF